MATIKAYTDISQSKKLAEILSLETLESADMYYPVMEDNIPCKKAYPKDGDYLLGEDIECWSLAALLGVLPKTINNETLFIETSPALWHIGYRNIYTARADNPVDTCVDLTLKLHEKGLL